MELLNSITLFEAEYLEIKYCICVIIWLPPPPPPNKDVTQSSVKARGILFYMCSILTNPLQPPFLSIEVSAIKRLSPIKSVKFAFTHYEHSTAEDLEIQIMSLILQQTCSEQTSLSTHSSVTLIKVHSSATNSEVQNSTGKFKFLPFIKSTISLV